MLEEYLQLNGIQHFAFCKRQWALMFLENQWLDNDLTNLGRLLHKRSDDPYFEEVRGDKVIIRGMPVISHSLRLNGVLDVVEFHQSKEGCKLKKREGLYRPEIIEYKKGKEKRNLHDVYQLVAEVIALEEMLDCTIEFAFLYYKKTNQRKKVEITDDLRKATKERVMEMHTYYKEQILPKAKVGLNCKLCSMKDICLPRMTHHKKNVKNYIQLFLGDKNEKIS